MPDFLWTFRLVSKAGAVTILAVIFIIGILIVTKNISDRHH